MPRRRRNYIADDFNDWQNEFERSFRRRASRVIVWDKSVYRVVTGIQWVVREDVSSIVEYIESEIHNQETDEYKAKRREAYRKQMAGPDGEKIRKRRKQLYQKDKKFWVRVNSGALWKT